jgi:hypothetical protein
MEFQDWIREERKIRKYISRQSVWEAALRLGTPAKQQATQQSTPCPVCGSNKADIQPCYDCKCKLWPDKHGVHL